MGKKTKLEKLRKEVFEERMRRYENIEEEEYEEEMSEEEIRRQNIINMSDMYNILKSFRDDLDIEILEYLTYEKFKNYVCKNVLD